MVRVYALTPSGERYLGQFSYARAAEVVTSWGPHSTGFSLHDGEALSGEFGAKDAETTLKMMAMMTRATEMAREMV